MSKMIKHVRSQEQISSKYMHLTNRTVNFLPLITEKEHCLQSASMEKAHHCEWTEGLTQQRRGPEVSIIHLI